MMKDYLISIILIASIILSCTSCQEGSVEPNPFVENRLNQDTVVFEFENVDPNTIAGIYQNVFSPTCANIGCHDGTFEPDFRTLESSYNSMIYQDVVKTDGSIQYRVLPGNASESGIIKRLEGAIAPQMPISLEPDSDWLEKRDLYIDNIKTWIDNGALDVFGNAAREDFFAPSISGVGMRISSQWYQREGNYKALEISESEDSLSLFFAFNEESSPESFSTNKIAFFRSSEGISADTILNLEVMNIPLLEFGLYGDQISYTHQLDIDSSLLSKDVPQWFFRAYVGHEANPVTEIPNDNALYYFKEYMSLLWVD